MSAAPNNQQARGQARREGKARARRAKIAITFASVLIFLATAAFARNSYAGHHKQPAHPLSPPQEFVKIVQKNQLEAGSLAPPQLPPAPETTQS